MTVIASDRYRESKVPISMVVALAHLSQMRFSFPRTASRFVDSSRDSNRFSFCKNCAMVMMMVMVMVMVMVTAMAMAMVWIPL